MKREERLAAWFNQSRVGLFIHWGMITGDHVEDPFGSQGKFHYLTAGEFEKAARGSDWNPSIWVDAAKRLGANFITFAVFHSCMGYLKAWPSSIPGSMHTNRDFLGELIDAAEEQNIKMVVYMTGDPNRHSFGGVEALQPDAYRTYKQNDEIDLLTHTGFLSYAHDVMNELIERYPQIAGFWFDGWHEREEAQHIFAQLHEKAPNMVLIRNNFDSTPVEDEDVMSLEVIGKRFEPPYDLASGTWVGPGSKEFCYKTIGDWFYLGDGHPDWKYYQDNYARVPGYPELIKKMISLVGSSWCAHLGFGPMLSGKFPAAVEKYIEHTESFLSWSGESVFDTVGGGYDQGGFPPGNWSHGAYGVTTLKPGTHTHYVHVLAAPKNGLTLELPDAGYVVTNAVDLQSGKSLSFEQKEGHLRIEVSSWDVCEFVGDQVIRLETDGAPRVIPRDAISIWATVESVEHPVKHVLNEDYEVYYDAGVEAEFPVSLTIRLQTPSIVKGLKLTQPESGAVVAGTYRALESERIQGCKVFLSTDGVEWGIPVFEGSLVNQRGLQVIRFPDQLATHIRLEVSSNYKGTNKLQLIYLDVIGDRG